MRSYTKEDITTIYSNIMRYAHHKYEEGHYRSALKGLEAAANWAYNLNLFYSDVNAEQLTKDIADKYFTKVKIENPITNRCVLIDSWLLDNKGLSQQYLRAMMSNNLEILIVHTNAGGSIGKDTLKEINSYDKAKIIFFSEKIDYIEATKQTVDAIKTFSPGHIFLHLTPYDLVALMACNAVIGPKKYQINLTDHAYWMGAQFVDYNLEFRPYGYTVSLEKRGLTPGQLLALPYYPIAPISADFAGFPDIPKDAVKVFSGGALYKMLGKDDIYFKILEKVLSIAPNVYILIAGFSQCDAFNQKIDKIKEKERILQIGVRKDIDAVFDNCDIYLGTYPMMGGLMSQYAAIHAKPIIAYHEEGDVMNAVEDMVNFYQNEFKSFTNLDEMVEYATRLVNDKLFRESQGKLLQNGMMNAERFNNAFIDVINRHQPISSWKKEEIDYESFFERYLDLENDQHIATNKVCSVMRIDAFQIFNSNNLNIFYILAKGLINKVMKLIK